AKRRLVEEQHPRPGDERAGEVEPLLHPAGVALHLLVRAVAEPDEVQQLATADTGLGRCEAGESGEVLEVLAAGEPVVEAAVAADREADVPAHLRGVALDVVS